MSPVGWVADCVPGQAPLGPGHGTFVGGCVCCGSGGCSVVPIGSSNRGLVTPQPEGMRTRGGEEGMREGPGQALFSNSGSGKSQAASLPRPRASLDAGWVLALCSVPEALGKRRKEWTRLDSPALLIPIAVGPAASAALPQHAPLSRGSGSAARPHRTRSLALASGVGPSAQHPPTCPRVAVTGHLRFCAGFSGVDGSSPGTGGRHCSAVPGEVRLHSHPK